jgi:hypothetical protein
MNDDPYMIEVPQYGIVVMPKGDQLLPNGRPVLMMALQITLSGCMHQFYLCDVSDNYQDVASKIDKMINEAGREGRRAQSGLVAVKGGSDGLRTEKQGRQLGGKGGSGSQGPRPA